MTPLQTLSRLLQVDPKTGTFILTGMALLAAAAMALAFGSNIDDAIVLAVYIMVFALAVTVLTFISRQETMRTTLSWIAIVAFGGWVAGLFGSALDIPDSLPPMPCYIRLPVELPEVCEARLSTTERIGGEAQVGPLPPLGPFTGPDRLWTIESHVTPPPTDLTVVLQFTGNVTRAETIALTTTLTEMGWVMSDGILGGEQVLSGPTENEVRFFRAEDNAAAILLAETLYAQNPGTSIAVRDFTRLETYAKSGLLEVWLNSLPANISQKSA